MSRHRDASDHVEAPILPESLRMRLLQQPVVFTLRGGDISTQVKYRQIKETLLLEDQQIQDAAGPAVSVIERMNALELVMRDRHTKDRIQIILRMKKVDQVVHQRFHLRRTLRRLIDDPPRCRVLQNGTRQFS